MAMTSAVQALNARINELRLEQLRTRPARDEAQRQAQLVQDRFDAIQREIDECTQALMLIDPIIKNEAPAQSAAAPAEPAAKS